MGVGRQANKLSSKKRIPAKKIKDEYGVRIEWRTLLHFALLF
jgi:hypothetical protein